MSISNIQAHQIGNELAGLEEMHGHGSAVAISKDGSTLAIAAPGYGGGPTGDGGYQSPQGYVYIYRKGAGVWELASEDQFIGQHGDFLGDSAVALSDDGNTIAFTSDWGRNLKIYSREDSGNWNLESDIQIPRPNEDWDTRPLSLSGDGKTIAIGIPGFDDNSSDSDTDEGAVFIYSKDGNNWSLTSEIIGSIYDGKSGQSISLSEDGRTIVIGEPGFEAGATGPGASPKIDGRAVVYSLVTDSNNTSSWTQVGNPIEIEFDETNSEQFFGGGNSVSISADGTIVAIGYPGSSSNSGSVSVFELDNDQWIQRGTTIWTDPDNPDDPSSFGRAVALSADGNTLAIGLPDDEGHVDVYTFDPSTSEYHFATGISGDPRDHSSQEAGIQSDRTGHIGKSLSFLRRG